MRKSLMHKTCEELSITEATMRDEVTKFLVFFLTNTPNLQRYSVWNDTKMQQTQSVLWTQEFEFGFYNRLWKRGRERNYGFNLVKLSLKLQWLCVEKFQPSVAGNGKLTVQDNCSVKVGKGCQINNFIRPVISRGSLSAERNPHSLSRC